MDPDGILVILHRKKAGFKQRLEFAESRRTHTRRGKERLKMDINVLMRFVGKRELLSSYVFWYSVRSSL